MNFRLIHLVTIKSCLSLFDESRCAFFHVFCFTNITKLKDFNSNPDPKSNCKPKLIALFADCKLEGPDLIFSPLSRPLLVKVPQVRKLLQ